MSINIGTNFDLESRQFLDSRQGLPKTIQDLKEWDILVPEGFEVVVDGTWYIFDSEYESEETGHWQKRIDSEYEGSNIETAINALSEHVDEEVETLSDRTKLLEDSVFPIIVEIEGDTLRYFEYGKETTVTFSWKSYIKGEEIVPDKVLINDEDVEDLYSYTTTFSKSSIKHVFTVTVIKDDLQSSVDITYRSKNIMYWGAIENESVIGLELDDQELFSSKLLINFNEIGSLYFDCTGGKYTHIIIKKSDLPENFILYSDGSKTSDYNIEEISYNRLNFVDIILGNKQTGKLILKLEKI